MGARNKTVTVTITSKEVRAILRNSVEAGGSDQDSWHSKTTEPGGGRLSRSKALSPFSQ